MNDLLFYLKLGWEHIISPDALDHQLFLTALAAIYLFADWKKVLILITAFTIGHSLTLALSVMDWIRFDEKWVEFLIPVTIVLTGSFNLIAKKRNESTIRWNYLMALLFGFIHGMGFANTIRFLLASDQQLWQGLLGFNIGLETGQVLVVLVLLSITEIFIRILNVARRDWIIFVSASVFSLALKMSLERLPF
jgi:hypothetical protein